MSKTPRTDAVTWMELVGMESNELIVVEADFARGLERELAAVTKERDDLRQAAILGLDCLTTEMLGVSEEFAERVAKATAALKAALRGEEVQP
jgi:hypothetical protein